MKLVIVRARVSWVRAAPPGPDRVGRRGVSGRRPHRARERSDHDHMYSLGGVWWAQLLLDTGRVGVARRLTEANHKITGRNRLERRCRALPAAAGALLPRRPRPPGSSAARGASPCAWRPATATQNTLQRTLDTIYALPPPDRRRPRPDDHRPPHHRPRRPLKQPAHTNIAATNTPITASPPRQRRARATARPAHPTHQDFRSNASGLTH